MQVSKSAGICMRRVAGVQVIVQSAFAAAIAYVAYEGFQRLQNKSKDNHGDDTATP